MKVLNKFTLCFLVIGAFWGKSLLYGMQVKIIQSSNFDGTVMCLHSDVKPITITHDALCTMFEGQFDQFCRMYPMPFEDEVGKKRQVEEISYGICESWGKRCVGHGFFNIFPIVSGFAQGGGNSFALFVSCNIQETQADGGNAQFIIFCVVPSTDYPCAVTMPLAEELFEQVMTPGLGEAPAPHVRT